MSVLAFRSGTERYLVRLETVRAVVRLRGLRKLPGSSGALAGVLDVHETPVAIYDTRSEANGAPEGGDVMVLAAGWPDHAVGIACDAVEGLLELGDPAESDGPPRGIPAGLPSYIEALLRVDGSMVPLVDVVGFAEASAQT